MTEAVFTQGSTMRHIVVMTLSSTVGLLSLFFVDLVDMYFLSLLGHEELAAAVGFSGTLLFFMTAVSIAFSITVGVTVAKALGEKQPQRASQLFINTLIYSLIFTSVISAFAFWQAESLLSLLGAKGLTLELATTYTTILLPTTPILAIAMNLASALRASGDAKRSMLAITGGGLVNAIFDPILIFRFWPRKLPVPLGLQFSPESRYSVLLVTIC